MPVTAEDARLRTADRLVRLIAVFCILGWGVFWMTMTRRAAPDAAPKLVLTHLEMTLLDRLVLDKKQSLMPAGTLAANLTTVAQLGGYMARTKDPPPGNTEMWRGLSRLTDINLGFMLARGPAGCG